MTVIVLVLPTYFVMVPWPTNVFPFILGLNFRHGVFLQHRKTCQFMILMGYICQLGLRFIKWDLLWLAKLRLDLMHRDFEYQGPSMGVAQLKPRADG